MQPDEFGNFPNYSGGIRLNCMRSRSLKTAGTVKGSKTEKTIYIYYTSLFPFGVIYI
jgi:hypothetical protein